ncbi:YTH domain-containing protein 1-like isoform X3 [Dysidea avara]|uniref:YTH domain-containing protein 1-like isoform X3 n=1 Tax=Dysidea avara TaxID=196820 RepID=UPI003325B595
MAEKDGRLDGKLNSEESEFMVGNEADSLSTNDKIYRRNSDELGSGDGRRHSQDSAHKDAGNEPQRTSVSDRILGEMENFLIESPKAVDDIGQDEDDVVGKPGEDDHEDILELQAGVDATIDDQFEVLDSAGDTDNIDNFDEGKKPLSSEDTRRRSKRSSEGRSHGDKESRSRESDSKGVSEVKDKEKSNDSDSGPHKIVDKIFVNTRYFVMKSNNYDNVDIAKAKSVWATPPYNEKKLNKSYRECKNVLLIFSVKESGRFQGFARLSSDSRRDIPNPPWVLPASLSIEQLGGVFKLDWIHRGELEFSHTLDLKNPWNDNKPVKISRDGQEVEPSVGEQLCRLWKSVSEEGNGHPSGSSGSGGMSATQLKFASRLGNVNSSSGGGGSSGGSSHHMSQTMPHHHHHHHHMPPHPMYAAPNPFMHPAAYHVQAIMAHQQRSGVLNQMMGGYHPQYPQSSSSKHKLDDVSSSESKKRRSEGDRDRERRSHSSRYESSSRSASGYHSSSRTSHEGRNSGHREGRERRRSRERESGSRRSKSDYWPTSHRDKGRDRRRSGSRSGSDSSMEEEYGVRKETLLHGSYDEYLKEYRSRGGTSSSKSGGSKHGITTDRITSICQQALAQALQQTTNKPMDQQTYAKMVESFLSKTRSGEKIGGTS